MTDHSTIRIAGAGPAGLSAAIALARGGRNVEVHEAKSDVGARFIGDLQVIENASEREDARAFLDRIGIETNFYFRPASAATFFDARGNRREITSERPYAYFVRRGPFEGSLDRGLLAQAREAGATVVFDSRIDPKSADIVATGPSVPDGLAREVTFESDAAEVIDVYFDHHLSPGGYSYLFILDGVGTFGCAIVSDYKNIDNYFDHALAHARSIRDFDPSRSARTGYSYMNFHLKQTAVANGSRYVGEAAGFQDYLFGLGIRYALTTGHLAAQSILDGRSFDDVWREMLAEKQSTSLVNRFLYEAAGNVGLSMFVRQAGRARDFHRYLASWHQPKLWKRLLAPLVRRLWAHHGRCLHKPGEHWCRSRDTQIRVPPLGPLQTEGDR